MSKSSSGVVSNFIDFFVHLCYIFSLSKYVTVKATGGLGIQRQHDVLCINYSKLVQIKTIKGALCLLIIMCQTLYAVVQKNAKMNILHQL